MNLGIYLHKVHLQLIPDFFNVANIYIDNLQVFKDIFFYDALLTVTMPLFKIGECFCAYSVGLIIFRVISYFRRTFFLFDENFSVACPEKLIFLYTSFRLCSPNQLLGILC